MADDSCDRDFEYLMNYRRRGYFLIISNEHFEYGPDGTEYKDRPEALIDRTRLSRTFESLGFICNTRLNVKAGEMLKAVDEFIKLDHSECDCAALAVLTHGDLDIPTNEDYLVGSDGGKVTLEELIAPIKRLPALKNKPKLIFVQACRGRKEDAKNYGIQFPRPSQEASSPDARADMGMVSFRPKEVKRGQNQEDAEDTFVTRELSSGVDTLVSIDRDIISIEATGVPQSTSADSGIMSVNPTEGIAASRPTRPRRKIRPGLVDRFRNWIASLMHTDKPKSVRKYPVTIPHEVDVLIHYSTIKGFKAWVRSSGSIFIQSICDVIDRNVKMQRYTSFVGWMMTVNGRVAADITHVMHSHHLRCHHQMPIMQNTLRADVILRPRPIQPPELAPVTEDEIGLLKALFQPLENWVSRARANLTDTRRSSEDHPTIQNYQPLDW